MHRSCIVGLVGFILLGTFTTTFALASDRISVEDVVKELRAGNIKQHDTLPLGRLPKPWVDGGKHDPQQGNAARGAMVLRDGSRVVILYHVDAVVHSACLYEASPSWAEHWFFCDTDKLAKHVELALKKE